MFAKFTFKFNFKTRPEGLLSINFEQILQAIFHLGQTKKTKDPATAIEIFLKREFPQLLNCHEEPHEAFLVPDSFIHGGIAAKVIL
jgi:hypothetical protein